MNDTPDSIWMDSPKQRGTRSKRKSKWKYMCQPGNKTAIPRYATRVLRSLGYTKPYRHLKARDSQCLKIQVARPGIEPRSSCSASEELNHSATAAQTFSWISLKLHRKYVPKVLFHVCSFQPDQPLPPWYKDGAIKASDGFHMKSIWCIGFVRSFPTFVI